MEIIHQISAPLEYVNKFYISDRNWNFWIVSLIKLGTGEIPRDYDYGLNIMRK